MVETWDPWLDTLGITCVAFPCVASGQHDALPAVPDSVWCKNSRQIVSIPMSFTRDVMRPVRTVALVSLLPFWAP